MSPVKGEWLGVGIVFADVCCIVFSGTGSWKAGLEKGCYISVKGVNVLMGVVVGPCFGFHCNCAFYVFMWF